MVVLYFSSMLIAAGDLGLFTVYRNISLLLASLALVFFTSFSSLRVINPVLPVLNCAFP